MARAVSIQSIVRELNHPFWEVDGLWGPSAICAPGGLDPVASLMAPDIMYAPKGIDPRFREIELDDGYSDYFAVLFAEEALKINAFYIEKLGSNPPGAYMSLMKRSDPLHRRSWSWSMCTSTTRWIRCPSRSGVDHADFEPEI